MTAGHDREASKLHLAVLLLGVGAALLSLSLRTPGVPARPKPYDVPPLALLPDRAALVATLDLDRLRQSALGASLFAEGRELPGLGTISQQCGFDPTAEVRRLALVVPAPRDLESLEFGVSAAGSFDPARVAECAATVVQKRGGSATRAAVGDFSLVRAGGESSGALAVRKDGLALLGAGAFLHEMIDAADGRVGTLDHDALHAALRRDVGESGALVVSFVLPDGWMRKLLENEGGGSSPLERVKAVALRVDFSPHVSARAVVGCVEKAACAELEKLVLASRDELAPDVKLLLGVPIAERLRIELRELELHVSLDLDDTEAGRVAEAVIELLAAPPTAP